MAELEKSDEALILFEDALARLENGMNSLHARLSDGTSDGEESAALLRERDQLADEVALLRGKAGKLADVNRKSAERIDRLINQIKSILAPK